MSADGADGFTMIGLHRLASQAGDGLMPELRALLMQRGGDLRLAENVLPFPILRVRPSGTAPYAPLGRDAAGGGNVIAFAPRPGQSGRRRKKV